MQKRKRGRPRKLNKYVRAGGVIIGMLLHGKCFTIDPQDYKRVKQYTWRAGGKNYVYTLITVAGRRKRIFLHRLIMGVQTISWKAVQVDHVNGNPLDNRRSNLRLASAAENQINKKKPRVDSTTKATGVTYRNGKWIASIGYQGGREFLGAFDTKEEAVKMRKEAEEFLYGEFSNKDREIENHREGAGIHLPE